MTAFSVVPGALVEVPAGVVVRGELVAVTTLTLVTSRGVETGLVTASLASLASLAGLSTLVSILTLTALFVNTLVTSPATEQRRTS